MKNNHLGAINMAGLKVFVSSTCYDLSILRSSIRNFIVSLGYEPIMSDYADVVYDPRQHTHTSCVEEVSNCDMLIVIIGSRFGGKSVPEALDKVDLSSVDKTFEDIKEKSIPISITQLEVIEAIKNNIPVYAFIDKKVYYQHELYEKNKNNVKDIYYTAIEKQETAKYIFEFINFLRHKSSGNSIFEFEKMQDIESILKKQWSGYFQRLLSEQRQRSDEQKQLDLLSEQFKDLKTALLSTIGDDKQREVASGIVNYRRMMEFFLSLKVTKAVITTKKVSLDDIFREIGIVEIVDAKKVLGFLDRPIWHRLFLIKQDKSFFDCRISFEILNNINDEWNSFKELPRTSKELIYDTLKELYSPRFSNSRYHSEDLDTFIQKYYSPSRNNELTLDLNTKSE